VSASGALGSRDAALPKECDVAIVGGGVMGLATAYHIAQTSKAKVVVLERSYLVSGASGRNGGGVRMQWGDEGNVRIMMESIEICRGLTQELGINLWFRQGGYLFIARSAGGEARLRRNAELHRAIGAPTRLLSGEEAREIVPELDISDVRLAAFNAEDGVVFPWPFVWGYAGQAIKKGVVVRTHTAASAAEHERDGLRLRLSTGESLWARTVVNATGAWSHDLNRSLGVELPNRPHRHARLPRAPRQHARLADAAARRAQGAAAVGRPLRRLAGRRGDRRPDAGASAARAGVRLHGPRLHDGAGGRTHPRALAREG
jgi:sarcosine oxidase subunit beta